MMRMSPSVPACLGRWQESCARSSLRKLSRSLRKSGKAMSAHETKRYTILLRKGDQVKVMSGRDAGKSGRVLAVNPRKNTVVVEHANLIKRHTRPNPSKNIKGGIIEKDAGLNASKVRGIFRRYGAHTPNRPNTPKGRAR